MLYPGLRVTWIKVCVLPRISLCFTLGSLRSTLDKCACCPGIVCMVSRNNLRSALDKFAFYSSIISRSPLQYQKRKSDAFHCCRWLYGDFCSPGNPSWTSWTMQAPQRPRLQQRRQQQLHQVPEAAKHATQVMGNCLKKIISQLFHRQHDYSDLNSELNSGCVRRLLGIEMRPRHHMNIMRCI